MDNLFDIFLALKTLLIAYEPPFATKHDENGYYDLWTFKSLVIEGRKRKEVFFAGLIIQKSYVGFYFMPVYTDNDLKQTFHPDLLELLKGKSCFHIKKLDPILISQIKDALQTGFNLYTEKGWVNA